MGASTDATVRPRPFHLAIYSDARNRGGAEMTLVQLLAGLPKDVTVSIVAVDEGVGSYIGDHRPGSTVHIIEPISRRSDLRGMRAHRRLFRSLGADLLQFNLTMGSSCQWAMLVAATMPRQMTMAVENSSMSGWSRASHWLKRVTSSRLSAHLAVGEATSRILETDIGLKPGSIETMYHGVADVDRSAPHELGKVIVNVARHDPVKGVDVLIEAMTMVPRDVRLVQIGSGDLTDVLVAQVAKLRLTDRVEFRDVDWSKRVADGLCAFPVFVLPSRSEGLPVTIMEAMLAGVAVVATDVGSVREEVLDGITGRVVPPEDPQALAAAIVDVLDDPARASAMGAAGRERALDMFTIEATIDRYCAVYARLVGSQPAGASRTVGGL